MNRSLAIIVAAVLGISLILSALLIRSGLLGIATAVRDKPIPKWPEELHIVAGDSKVNLDIANLSVQQGSATAEARISVDNVRVTVPATQPSR